MEFHEIANLFPMMGVDEFEQLKEDIKQNGLIEPIVLYEDKILDGRNRWLACGEVNQTPVFESYTDDQPVSFVISKNLHRRHLNPTQLGVVARKIENYERGRPKKDANLHLKITRDEAASIVGVSPRTVASVKRVEEKAPELMPRLESGEMTVHEAEKMIKKAERKKELESRQNPVLPDGKYSVIYADPPWPVGSIVMDKWESPINDKYPTMTIDEIKALPVIDLSHDKCSLFMWTTHTFLPDALEIIKEWGFKYSCCITWDKGNGWTQFGFHKRTEFLLFAYKGGINVDQYGDAIPTLISEKKTYHSKKPDTIRNLIKNKTPEPRLEMFARGEYDGWDVWGNEVNNGE